jgi:hypothetical protein
LAGGYDFFGWGGIGSGRIAFYLIGGSKIRICF